MTAETTARQGSTSDAATTSFPAVAAAISQRGLVRMLRLPSLIFPAIIMPVFFVVAFSGSFAAAVQIEGYGTDKAVNWMTAWAVLQGGAFAGVGSAGAAATDLENGFFDRIRLAPVNPLAVVVGLLGYSLIRALVPVSTVLAVAFVFLDADMPGGFLGLVMVYVGRTRDGAGDRAVGHDGGVHVQDHPVAGARADPDVQPDVPVDRPGAPRGHPGVVARRGHGQSGHPGHRVDPTGVPRRRHLGNDLAGPGWPSR